MRLLQLAIFREMLSDGRRMRMFKQELQETTTPDVRFRKKSCFAVWMIMGCCTLNQDPPPDLRDLSGRSHGVVLVKVNHPMLSSWRICPITKVVPNERHEVKYDCSFELVGFPRRHY